MSMERNEYVIVGYDLSAFRNELYTDEWADNQENIDEWENNQIEGKVQLFSDTCSGSHLYFGYIIHRSDGYDERSTRKHVANLQRYKDSVDEKLHQAFKNLPRYPFPYELICFTEYR